MTNGAYLMISMPTVVLEPQLTWWSSRHSWFLSTFFTGACPTMHSSRPARLRSATAGRRLNLGVRSKELRAQTARNQ
jgi:hypothetical protein